MNPYIERILNVLGTRDPIEVLQATPLRIEEILQDFTPADMESSYGIGKWNARQILAHLADVELGHAFRFRQTLAEEDPVVQPFDQDRWAKRYSRADVSLAVAAFSSVRSWNLTLLSTLDLDDWLKEAYHPERGMVSMDLMVRTLAGHDLNHLAQLQQIGGGGAG